MVFSYIEKNNIGSTSKIADVIRADDVVLRLYSEEDARKVMEYINSTPEIRDNLKPTNPFLCKNGNIGMAYDHMISYNATLSELMSEHYKECRKNNDLENVSMESFKTFVKKYKIQQFSSRNNLKQLLGDCDGDRFGSLGEKAYNYYKVYELIEYSLNENCNMDKYFKMFNEFENGFTNLEQIKYFNDFISAPTLKNPSLKQILDDYIIYAIKKYDSTEQVILQLNNYINGDNKSITRDNDFRQKFIEKLTPDFIQNITNFNLESYINRITNITKESNNIEKVEIIEKEKTVENGEYDIFYNACKETYIKYGIYQLRSAINRGLKGDYSHFTNGTGNYRKIMKEILNKDEFFKCVFSIGIKNDSEKDIVNSCCDYFENEYPREIEVMVK